MSECARMRASEKVSVHEGVQRVKSRGTIEGSRDVKCRRVGCGACNAGVMWESRDTYQQVCLRIVNSLKRRTTCQHPMQSSSTPCIAPSGSKPN